MTNPVAFIEEQPSKYVIRSGWIWYEEDSKEKEGDIVTVPISTVFKIKRKILNKDTSEIFYECEVSKHTIFLSGVEIGTDKGIEKLMMYGLVTVKSKFNKLSDYIFRLRLINDDNYPKLDMYDSFGWKGDGSFIIGNKRITTTEIQTIEFMHDLTGLKQSGTTEGWIKSIDNIMNYNSQRFKMYNAMSAPLLKLIGIQNHCLSDCGDTAKGKTISSMVCMSAFGNPAELIVTGNTTKVGIELRLGIMNDLPILIDDVQNLDEKLLNDIIYMIANGTGKLRGNIKLTFNKTKHWQSVALFTSEKPLIREESFGGIVSRLIETNGGIGHDDDISIAKYIEGVKIHYGTFGLLYIDWLVKNKSVVLEWFDTAKERLNKYKSKLTANKIQYGLFCRQLDTYAAILTAGEIFEMLYEENGGTSKKPEDIIYSIIEKRVPHDTESYTQRGLDFIMSWISANKSNFLNDGIRQTDTYGNDKQYKIFGTINETHYDILPNELNMCLKNSGFDKKRLINDFKDVGYLLCDKEKNQHTIRLEGKSTKVYSLIRKNINY